jgi:hypothetical protein
VILVALVETKGIGRKATLIFSLMNYATHPGEDNSALYLVKGCNRVRYYVHRILLSVTANPSGNVIVFLREVRRRRPGWLPVVLPDSIPRTFS